LRRHGAISILIILSYTQFGYFGQFIIRQWILKEEAREAWIAALPDRCFFRVQLAAVDATGRWTEEGRECWYNNHLYDVIRRKSENGIVWLYCMDDQREANLIRKSGELTHDNQGNPDKQTNHSLSPRVGDWLAEMTSLRLDRPLALVDRRYGDWLQSLPAGCVETFAPPPKI
jgi:hypothetical protein